MVLTPMPVLSTATVGPKPGIGNGNDNISSLAGKEKKEKEKEKEEKEKHHLTSRMSVTTLISNLGVMHLLENRIHAFLVTY